MNALAATPRYEEIRQIIACLSVEEQLRLIGEITSYLQKKIPAQPFASTPPAARTGTLRGKYAYVPTSSDRFAAAKQQEIEQER
jgi:hypothetical protein